MALDQETWQCKRVCWLSSSVSVFMFRHLCCWYGRQFWVCENDKLCLSSIGLWKQLNLLLRPTMMNTPVLNLSHRLLWMLNKHSIWHQTHHRCQIWNVESDIQGHIPSWFLHPVAPFTLVYNLQLVVISSMARQLWVWNLSDLVSMMRWKNGISVGDLPEHVVSTTGTLVVSMW